jgi:hypothetical protein
MSVTTRDIKDYTLYSGVTITSGFNSTSINRDVMDGYCIVANIAFNTSTSIGYFWLQASIDDSVYTNISNSTSTVSSAGSVMWDVSVPYYNYVRVQSTLTTANINCTITARSVSK